MGVDLRELETLLASCTLMDRARFERRLQLARRHQRRAAADAGTEIERLAAELERAASRARRRREALPLPSFPPELPVSGRKDEIAAALRGHQVVVVCGETGSGKTTQLPKICLELGLGWRGAIGHTQPRRIAARSVAARIAEELRVPLGGPGGVGYKVRFGDKTHPDSAIKVMTDGILLAETQGDRRLLQYEAIIVDEAHERSLNIDFLLGYLRQLLPSRPDLRVIVTSATIDPERFARHFAGPGGPAPIIEVSGRTYPVEVRYRPLAAADEDREDLDLESGVLRAVDELARETSGDVLVFLPGEREIREAAEALRKHHPAQTEILPLYARLSAAEQQRVFEPHQRRRIVLATNVAETSLTVPGIRAVVDSGLARISRYSPGTKVQRLPVEAVSQASANQRAGRCGRVAAGVCIRLYGEADLSQRPVFTDPEILRTNLASVILQMASLQLGTIEAFPFIDPPERRLIRDGYDTLFELGAIDEEQRITPIGHELAKLPMDPRIGRMVLAAAELECLDEVLPIAAALATQDPRDRPIDRAAQADEAHARFEHESSDFLTLLNLWRAWQDRQSHLSHSKLRKWCHEHFLSHVRMREWDAVHQQLHELLADMGYQRRSRGARTLDEERVHRALLPGLLGNIGRKGEQGFYRGARGKSFKIFPGSTLFGRGPGWVMAAEIVETTQLYARTCARIDPGWIESAAGHLVKRTHGEGVWDRDSGSARVPEKVSLFGLEIAAGRLVPLAPIDAAAARQLFIHHALVEGDYAIEGPYRAHNRRVMEEVRRIEAKTRRPDAVADLAARHAFFDRRIPREVVDGTSFERWRRLAERAEPRLLFWNVDDLLDRGRLEVPTDQLPRQFPDRIEVEGTQLRVDYRYDPGSPTDGVTVTLPIEALNQFDARRADWLVPGHVPRKVEALLESLPKPTRKALGAVGPVARRAAEELTARAPRSPMDEAVAERVRALTGVALDPRQFKLESLPEHVRLNYRVVDESGRELGLSRDLDQLRAELGDRAKASFTRLARSPLDRDGLTDWSLGDLPETVQVSRQGATLTGYPAVLDTGRDVSVRVLESARAAAEASRAGLRRLFAIQARGELAYQYRLLVGLERVGVLHAAFLGARASLDVQGAQTPRAGGETFGEQMTLLIAELAFLEPLERTGGGDHRVPIRTKDEFDRALLTGMDRISTVGAEACAVVEDVLVTWQRLALRLDEMDRGIAAPGKATPAVAAAVADVRSHAALLLPRDFLAITPWRHLRHVPRYLSASLTRLSKLPLHAARDAESLRQLSPLWNAFLDTRGRCERAGVRSATLEDFRWLLEELRVSLFAQELRTAVSVSVPKLERQWSELKL